MIKNYLKEIKYIERKSFLNRKIDFNNNVIKPISEDVVTMIKDKFSFCEGSTKDASGRKQQNLKFFMVCKLLSIYRRGINKKITINYNSYKESYYGDTFDFLSICNECLQLGLGSPHAIAKLGKDIKKYNLGK